MFDYDRSNFIAFLKQFPDQVSESVKMMKKVSIDLDGNSIYSIVFSGMGGSAIAGELLQGYVNDQLAIPVAVNRDYTIPNFVNKHTLFCAVSYSGDTEETLSAVREAMAHSAHIIGISSGGELEKVCRENGHTHIMIPGGMPPRQALGYIFFPLLLILEKAGLIKVAKKDITETIEELRMLVERYMPEKSLGHCLANHISQSIYHAIPVIYSGVPYLNGVTVRWRNQFNENSKVIAFSNVFPELNHNEIVGWEGLHEVNKHFRVIFLRDLDETPRVKERIDITKKVLKKHNVLFGEIFAEGRSRLTRMFSLIATGDWASYYLAMLNEKEPIKIESIDFLKTELSKVGS